MNAQAHLRPVEPLDQGTECQDTEVPADAVWLTVPEAAKLLRIGDSLCWKLVHDQTLPSRKVGRLVRVPRSAVVPA